MDLHHQSANAFMHRRIATHQLPPDQRRHHVHQAEPMQGPKSIGGQTDLEAGRLSADARGNRVAEREPAVREGRPGHA